jgi:hypothetical protein
LIQRQIVITAEKAIQNKHCDGRFENNDFVHPGPSLNNCDDQPTNVRKRRASKRHVNPSTNGDDPESKVAALVLQANHKVIDHLNVASPVNGFPMEYETSPDSGVFSNSNENAADKDMACVQTSNNFQQTNEEYTDKDVPDDQLPVFEFPLLSPYSPERLDDFQELIAKQENQNPSIFLGPSNSDPMWGSHSYPKAFNSNVEHTEHPKSDSLLDDFDVEYDARIVADGVRQRKSPEAALTQPRASRTSVVRPRGKRRSSVEYDNRSVAVQKLIWLKEMFLRNYGLIVVAGCIGAAAICRQFY